MQHQMEYHQVQEAHSVQAVHLVQEVRSVQAVQVAQVADFHHVLMDHHVHLEKLCDLTQKESIVVQVTDQDHVLKNFVVFKPDQDEHVEISFVYQDLYEFFWLKEHHVMDFVHDKNVVVQTDRWIIVVQQ